MSPGQDPSASSSGVADAPARAWGAGWLAGVAFAAFAAGGGTGTVVGRGDLGAQLARVGDKVDRVGADVTALRAELKGDVRDARTDLRELEARVRVLEQRAGAGS